VDKMDSFDNISTYVPIYSSYMVKWDISDYYFLNRTIQKLFNYYGKENDKYIKMIDLNQTSYLGQVLMKCAIETFNKQFLYDKYPNIRELRDVKPLPIPITIMTPPMHFGVYAEMNVIY